MLYKVNIHHYLQNLWNLDLQWYSLRPLMPKSDSTSRTNAMVCPWPTIPWAASHFAWTNSFTISTQHLMAARWKDVSPFLSLARHITILADTTLLTTLVRHLADTKWRGDDWHKFNSRSNSGLFLKISFTKSICPNIAGTFIGVLENLLTITLLRITGSFWSRLFKIFTFSCCFKKQIFQCLHLIPQFENLSKKILFINELSD